MLPKFNCDLFSGQLVTGNSQNTRTQAEPILDDPESQVTPDELFPCGTDGSFRCSFDDFLRRRRRGANHAHKALNAQKKGDRIYFYNSIDVIFVS
mgnify:CR=1 FL=1